MRDHRRQEEVRGSAWSWALALGLAALLGLTLPGNSLLAAEGSAGGGKGQAMQGGQGGHGQGGPAVERGMRGGVEDKIFTEEDEDSDRPEWAQGNRDLNPHAQGGGQPPEAGSKKGDMYGDLWVLLRDPATGLPILDEFGNVQPIVLLPDGTTLVIQLTEEGDVPAEYADYLQEVEFGRLSVGRSPSKVTEHALNEVIDKLRDSSEVTLDAAGRLVIDGTTVDSPLENLALYGALLTADPALTPVADKLDGFDTLTLASSLLAAAGDKTGTIGIDLVAYENVILGISPMTPDDYFDYSTFDYSRDATYSGDISYYLQQADGTVILVTEPIMDAVFDGVSYTSEDGSGITDFAQAADDALQVIEFIHTTVHVE